MKTQEVKETVSTERLFYIEMLAALDALKDKNLSRGSFFADEGNIRCALGAWMLYKGATTYAEGAKLLANKVCHGLMSCAGKIMNENDKLNKSLEDETNEERYVRMKAWFEQQIMG